MDICEAIIRILNADDGKPAQGVWEDIAPRLKRPPYVIVGLASDTEEHTHDQIKLKSGIVDVKAITQSDEYGTGEAIRDWFHALLDAVNSSETYGIHYLLRGGEIRYYEMEDDVRYNHVGYQYRFLHSGLTESEGS